MTAAAFCNIQASTKRNPELGGGRNTVAVPHLASIMITPLWPVGGATVQTLGITGNQIREMKECYHVPTSGTALPDVRERDILVVGGAEYPVSSVAEWPDWEIPTLHIVVGEVKQRA